MNIIKNPVELSKKKFFRNNNTKDRLPESTSLPALKDTIHAITESPLLINNQ